MPEGNRQVMVTVRVEPLSKQELPGIATAVFRVDDVGNALDIARSLLDKIQTDVVAKVLTTVPLAVLDSFPPEARQVIECPHCSQPITLGLSSSTSEPE